jgi:hypothetical protein
MLDSRSNIDGIGKRDLLKRNGSLQQHDAFGVNGLALPFRFAARALCP